MTSPAPTPNLLHSDQKKEQFSHAFIHAIVSAAGLSRFRYDTDQDSVDVGVSGQRGTGQVRSPKLDIQLKCTSSEDKGKPQGFSYPLSIKNYDDLRDPDVLIPRILVVVTVPSNESLWLQELADHMIMRHSAYWLSLRGQPASENDSGIRVTLSRSNRFNAQTLATMMDTLRNGGSL